MHSVSVNRSKSKIIAITWVSIMTLALLFGYSISISGNRAPRPSKCHSCAWQQLAPGIAVKPLHVLVGQPQILSSASDPTHVSIRALRHTPRFSLDELGVETKSLSEQCYVSYTLYGENPLFAIGIFRNIELTRTIFPGWTVRVYIDTSISLEVTQQLADAGAEVFLVNAPGIARRAYRFLIHDDPTVDRWISRDADSRLSRREQLAVDEWITTGKCLHTMADHPYHSGFPIIGGMFGFRRLCAQTPKFSMAHLLQMAMNDTRVNWELKSSDQDFLTAYVAPIVNTNDWIEHNAFYCDSQPYSIPFNSLRDEKTRYFVGDIYNTDIMQADDLSSPLPLHSPEHELAQQRCSRF